MKKHLRKTICLLVCILLIVSLNACTDKENDNTSSGTDTVSEETATAKVEASPVAPVEEYKYTGSAPISDEKIVISILSTNSGSKILGFDEMIWWQKALELANVELEMEEIDWSSYNDVVRPRLAAAIDLPDIIRVSGMDDDMAYSDSGIFLELSEYYEEYGYNLKKQFEENKNLRAEITTPEGEIYYLPYIYATADNSRCLMMHTGFLENVGMSVDDIKTLDDYYDYLTKVKNTDANGNGDAADEIPLFMRSGSIDLWATYWGLDSNGFQVEDDGTVICGFTDDRYLDYLTYMNKLFSEGLLYSEFATAKYDTQTALYSNNQVGSILHYISNCTSYSQTIDSNWDFYNDMPIMMPIVPPKGPYGDQYVTGRDALGFFFGITTSCENPEDVFKFCDYLYSEEIGQLTWYGIEGTDYNVNNGEILFTDLYINNEDGYRGKQGYNFCGLPSYQYGNGYMATQAKDVRDMSKVLAEYVMNPSIPFSFNNPEENEVLQAYLADIKTYLDENRLAFIMGSRPLSEWDEYVNTVNSMHLSEVLDVYQTIADRASGAN